MWEFGIVVVAVFHFFVFVFVIGFVSVLHNQSCLSVSSYELFADEDSLVLAVIVINVVLVVVMVEIFFFFESNQWPCTHSERLPFIHLQK